MRKPAYPTWPMAFLVIFAAYPLFPALDEWFFSLTNRSLGEQIPGLFIFAMLALALNVVVGYVGILHLGIAAFFGIGAYITGILTVPAYPFEIGFWGALLAAAIGTALFGGFLAIPILRLRGDYLALVTLGFGEVVKFTLRNLDAITAGTRGLNPVPPPSLPAVEVDWVLDYRPFYYLTLGFLVATYLLLGRLERSRLGRAWVAVREDELAATCMGLNAAQLKLAAFIFAAGLAGLAGCLYASRISSTADPNAYDFNKSVFVLCCIILGGLGSRNGALLGVFALYGFDQIVAPIVDGWIQQAYGTPVSRPVVIGGTTLVTLPAIMFTFTGWKLMVFGMVLILMMRFRPEGWLPSDRVKEEFHPEPNPGATVREEGP